jgi:hypothetical protein
MHHGCYSAQFVTAPVTVWSYMTAVLHLGHDWVGWHRKWSSCIDVAGRRPALQPNVSKAQCVGDNRHRTEVMAAVAIIGLKSRRA